MRRLWPKYDKDLDRLVGPKGTILELIEKSFEAAGLTKEFLKIVNNQKGNEKIEKQIYDAAEVSNQFSSKE